MELRDKNGLTEAEFLASYNPKDYPHPALTADIALFSKGQDSLKILLIKRGGHPYLGCWALPGGFTEKNESVDQTASRELFEETGLTGIELSQVGLFSEPNRDPRGWTMSECYTAVIDSKKFKPLAGDDANDAQWFDISYKKLDNIIMISFSSGDTEINVQLKMNNYSTYGCKNAFTFQAFRNSGLAFDHDLMIASALNKNGLI